MEEYRLVQKKFGNKNKKKKKNKLFTIVNTLLLTILIFVVNLILCKTNRDYKEWVYKNIYNNNFSFAKIEEIYNKYFGSLFPTSKNNNDKTLAVSTEKLSYENLVEIDGGVQLTVTASQTIPVFESGVIVFAGTKNELGSTIIVEQIDGNESWYVNVDTENVKIYDYVEKGNILTTVKGTTLKMLFKDDGEIIDYKKYIF